MSSRIKAPSRRALLAGAPAVAAAALAGGTVTNALVIAEAKAAEVDPIFAVIAEHHAIMAGWRDALRRENEFWHTPAGDAAGEEASDACGREKEHLLRVLTVQPTTLAGVVALLDHVGQEEFLNSEEGDESEETVLSSWCDNDGDPLQEAAKSFPSRLAATMRSILGRAA
jgi:hypothetical protein